MNLITSMVKRNSKIFFKDKGMFFASIVTPLILLVLYTTFLSKVYKDSFHASLPAGFGISDKLINAIVGGELFSSLLAVCCVTVAFNANMLMVQDKITGARRDLMISPLKKTTLALSYYLAAFAVSLIICYIACGACFIYLAKVGWYLSGADVMSLIIDVFLLSLFGTAISSIINYFLSSQGQMSAVATIISAGYGFICGAYMPISNFGEGLQKVISYLPGTYGTSLIRNHALRGAFKELGDKGVPKEALNGVKEAIDCRLYFNDKVVSLQNMYVFLTISTIVLIGIYIAINIAGRRVK